MHSSSLFCLKDRRDKERTSITIGLSDDNSVHNLGQIESTPTFTLSTLNL